MSDKVTIVSKEKMILVSNEITSLPEFLVSFFIAQLSHAIVNL